MNSTIRRFLVITFWLPLFFVSGRETNVGPGRDFETIQAALDASSDGGEIVVFPGRYKENILFKGRNVTLRSSAPTSPSVVRATIIDGDQKGSVITFDGTEETSCVLSGFTITRGSAFDGGGIQAAGGRALIQNNVIELNTAGNSGGGIYRSNGLIRNNLILQNSAAGYWDGDFFIPGSGNALSECNGTIQNNTIAFNETRWGSAVSRCRGRIMNCLFWKNGKTLFSDSSLPSYCCIEGWSGGGVGNIDEFPWLKNPEAGDYHLLSWSPCIDAGAAAPELSHDFEGDPRPFDAWPGPRGDGSDIDIGADEFIGTVQNTPTPTPTPTPEPTPSTPPTITMLTPASREEISTGTYTLRWIDDDPDNNAAISLFYVDFATGTGDTLIVEGISEDDETDAFHWNTETVPEGLYQVYALIRDNYNPAVKSTAPGSIVIIHVKEEELIGHLTGSLPLPPARRPFADFNRDGRIDIADYITALQE